MLLELIGATTFTVFASLFSGQPTPEGLELPKDPNQQVKVLASHALSQLKEHVIGQRVTEVTSSGIRFADGSQLVCEAGALFRLQPDGGRQRLAFLGDRGGAEFEKTASGGLLTTLWAELDGGVRHQVSARLSLG